MGTNIALSAAQNWLKENRRTDRPVSVQIKQSHTKENATVLTYFNAGEKKKVILLSAYPFIMEVLPTVIIYLPSSSV